MEVLLLKKEIFYPGLRCFPSILIFFIFKYLIFFPCMWTTACFWPTELQPVQTVVVMNTHQTWGFSSVQEHRMAFSAADSSSDLPPLDRSGSFFKVDADWWAGPTVRPEILDVNFFLPEKGLSFLLRSHLLPSLFLLLSKWSKHKREFSVSK